MDPFGKLLVFSRVTDEAGVELDGPFQHRADVGNEVVGNAAAAEEDFGNLAARLVDGINADCGWAVVFGGFEAFRTAQIDISELRSRRASLSEVGLLQDRRVAQATILRVPHSSFFCLGGSSFCG
jgi:hypothetical protein